MAVSDRAGAFDSKLIQFGQEFIQPSFIGGERIGRQATRVGWPRPLFALQVNAHALAADLNERMRHRAALALAHVQAVALAEYAGKDAAVKLFGDGGIIHWNDEMIERLREGHNDLHLMSRFAAYPA